MDTWELIKNKREELSELHARMDVDIGILTLPFVLKGFAEQLKDQPIPNSVSVTLNKAANFADDFIATLSTVTRQPVVEGLSGSRNHEIEDFATDLLYTIDEKQRRRGRGTSAIWLADQVSKRGPIGYKLSFDKGGNLIPKPIDMRWATWQEKGEGYKWIAYQMLRDADSIRGEYSDVKGANISLIPDGRELEVEDWWDDGRNELWAGGVKFCELENPYGFLPFCLEFPLTGTFIEDRGYLKYRWESIFALNRDLYPEWNRLASILQTMGVAILYPAVAETSPDGTVTDPYPYPGSVNPFRTGEEMKVLWTPEITNAFMTALQNLDRALQQGGIPDVSFGETNPDVTGIRYTQIWTSRLRRMNPRIECMSHMYSGLVKLAIKEILALIIKPKLGKSNKDYSDLPDPDTLNISFRLMPDDKVMEIVRLMQGKGMQGFMSLRDIYKDIIHHEDPDGAINRLYLEQAILADPITRYRELSRRARVEAKDDNKSPDEKKDLIENAKYFARMMVQAMKMQSMESQGQPVEQPKGQAAAMQAARGMLNSGNGQKQLPQRVI